MPQNGQPSELIEKCKFFNSLRNDAVRRGGHYGIVKIRLNLSNVNVKNCGKLGKCQKMTCPPDRFLHEYPDYQDY